MGSQSSPQTENFLCPSEAEPGMDTKENKEVAAVEFRLLLEGMYQVYGWDFRDYAQASLKRRIWKCIREEHLSSVSRYQERILHDPACMQRFLLAVSVDTTEMFRDPRFYVAFRKKVGELLRPLPSVRLWHLGCATGEEVYSMAILLEEEGLYEKSRLYATDMNEALLAKAREGIFPMKAMQGYTDNYLKAGGKRAFSEYYTARYEHALFRPALQKHIVWAQHNLVTDGSFNEFQVILCRNVLIYFDRPLHDRIHSLLYESLAPEGILGLGSKESLMFTPHAQSYEVLDERARLYRRVK